MITRDYIYQQVVNARGDVVIIEWRDIQNVFGFKRVDGQEYMMLLLFRPSMTELQASMLPSAATVQAFKDWCEENLIDVREDFGNMNRSFIMRLKLQH